MSPFEGTERYRITRQLGAGGMGVVYEAIDAVQNERVALKTLHEMEPDALFRFKREFRALHGLEHPNLVRLGELVEHEGVWFFTMELVAGEDFLTHVWTKDWRSVAHAATEAATVRGGRRAYAGEARGDEPAAAAFEEGRLRAALRQLAAGIVAVHDAGKVHRDIKPSNVVVGHDGRVVLLDFGLVTGMERGERSTVAAICGTPQYMAPEQVAVGRVGPAADWYALGVMLYEALTARLPVAGTPVEIMTNKLRLEPPPPSSFRDDVPADLDQLCADLLRIEPGARPSGAGVLARLGGPTSLARRSTKPPAPPFLGRGRELGALDEAWATCRRERRATTVLLDGRSGMGKSALLRAFARRREDADPGVVVLEGRAYEHESIPFNVFDHVIDALARLLRALTPERAAELMPRNAWLLPRLFPGLARVAPIVRLHRAMHLELDAEELRARCFSAFRELVARIAERHPLVMVLDDLQWAGRDSMMLLAEIVRPPDPPPMLLVLASREGRLADPHATRGEEARAWWGDDAARVHLGRLAPEDARALARESIEAQGVELDASAIAEEAEGHPLFIQELVRYASAGLGPPSERPRLDDAIRARTRAMEPHTRQVLELAVVAGGPLPRDVLARAAQLDSQALARELGALDRAHLVRADSVSVVDAVVPFHDRVREAMLADLDPDQRRACHARLAAAYEAAGDADAMALARHLAGAGERARAAETAQRAAERAEGALAFDRAAELYELALELRGEAADAALRVKLAGALGRAGRSLESADAYAAASAQAAGSAAMELQGLSAREYVRGGQFDRGMAIARAVLSSIGVRLPGGPRAAIVRLLFLRFLLFMRGLRFPVRAASEVKAEDARRVDLLHDLAVVTTGADAVIGTWLTARALLEAERVGEASRLSRALSLEAAWLAGMEAETTPRIGRLMGVVRDLDAKATKKSGWAPAMSGIIALNAGRYAEAEARLAEGYAAFAAEPGSQFEVAMASTFSILALYVMGRLAEVRETSQSRLRVALDAGDRYYAAFHRIGPCNVAAWLAPDEPARAREELAAGVASWSRPRFDMIAYAAWLARVEIALYEGRGAEAWEAVTSAWGPLARSMMLRVRLLRAWAWDARGRAAVAYAAESAPRRDELLGEAERAARKLDARRSPTGGERAALIRSGIASLRGDPGGERRALEGALAGLEARAMGAHAAVARRRLGALEGGDAGRARVVEADAWLAAQKVARPEKWEKMLLPRGG